MNTVDRGAGGAALRAVLRASVVVWSLLMIGAASWLGIDAGSDLETFLPATVGFVIVGAILTIRRPSNAVGPLALIAGSAWITYLFGIAYGTLLSTRPDGALAGVYAAGWVASWIGALFPLTLSLLVMFFPEGQPRGWWRLSLLLPGAGLVALVPGAIALWGLPLETLVNGNVIDQAPGYVFIDAGYILGFYATIPATFTLAARYRAGGPVERHQIKWLMAATGLFAVCFAVAVTDEENLILWVMVGIALLAVPVAIMLAVLRYRLYDIDRLVSRTVGYGLVLAVLGLVYGVGAVWLPTRMLGEQPPLFVAGATLAAAALFNPVRRRVLLFVDRRFHRSRYDAERVAEGFTSRLRHQVDPSMLADDLAGVVTRTLHPSSVGVWVRETS